MRAEKDALNVLGEKISHKTIMDALRIAHDIGAIANGEITVPAGHGPTAPRVKFSYLPETEDRWGGTEREETLMIEYVAELNPDGLWRVHDASQEWKINEDPATVFDQLTHNMVKRGYAHEANQLQITETLGNLFTAVKDAVASRRADGTTNYTPSPFIELLKEDWAIKTSGLELRDRGSVLSLDKFKESMHLPQIPNTQKEFPRKPEWVATEDWDVAMQRMLWHFPPPISAPF